jgi:hypothetical protein
MRRRVALALLAVSVVGGGCVALGWRFGPGFSCADKTLFAAPPVVVHRGGDFFLTWTQGRHPFFFLPSYQVRDGRLVFALVATSSSGSVAGQPQEMKVEGDDNIAALRRGGAFWWDRDPQPTGTLVPLRLITQR